jgi:UDP-galactopyranose mutase
MAEPLRPIVSAVRLDGPTLVLRSTDLPIFSEAASSPLLAGDLICFSHLRWDFVFQRPQHLMSRFARRMRVFFWEEPAADAASRPMLEAMRAREGVTVLRPHLPPELDGMEASRAQAALLDRFCREQQVSAAVLWYYTPLALDFSDHLDRSLTVYDCMDELSAFRGAHPALREREHALMQRADLVFTGGLSLYEARRSQHRDVHAFPSSVDLAHFRPARDGLPDPADQAPIPRPRLGFFGVLDERLDQDLLARVAQLRPDWQVVMVGPVVKIDPAALPQAPNIHYLGPKSYAALPSYLSGWDIALMPFACNEATRFISPTKTPEYLAAGRPVVSTPIADVVRTYGRLQGVRIAARPEEFIGAAEQLLAMPQACWQAEADGVLAQMSWDRTWDRMAGLMASRRARRARPALPRPAGAALAMPACLGAAHFDALIVGAGFAGSVMAERLAAGSGKRVLLVDRRPHIGGNAHDHHDAAGLLVHRYGPHIFHTNSRRVADYLSRFTAWRPYEHRVLARIGDVLLPVPINRTTVNRFFGLQLGEAEVEAFLAQKAEKVPVVRTSEDVVLSRVGRELYEAFFRGYTRKQWGVDPSQLDKSVTARVPTRTNDDDRYFGDHFQNMPLHGFTRMFEAMLDHPNITLSLGTDYRDIRDKVRYDRLIFTGPVDEFFDYRYGKLPYRSLRFEHRTLPQERFQPVAVVNYPSPDVPYTRITEYKHLTGQAHRHTSITTEYPSDEGDPYYPVPRAENAALYARYQALADGTPNVFFVGRLATYRYYNMDQVVGQALALYARLSGSREAARGTFEGAASAASGARLSPRD